MPTKVFYPTREILARCVFQILDTYLLSSFHLQVKADVVDDLEKFRGKAEPTWILFAVKSLSSLKNGKALVAVHGSDAPRLISTIREQFNLVKKLASKHQQVTHNVVLLDSLVKPEEELEDDEDLEDVLDDTVKVHPEDGADAEDLEAESPFQTGVLFISHHVIAKDRAEDFLSAIVSAGLELAAHVQEDLDAGVLHDLLHPPPSPPPSPSAQDGDDEGEPKEEEEGEVDGEGTRKTEEKGVKENEEAEETTNGKKDVDEDDIDFWEAALSQGPLYLLLLSLGFCSLSSLVAQFGEEATPVPAWLPQCRSLQKALIRRFFPPPPDAHTPRLLLLPDTEHQQVLRSLTESGIKVWAHTQVRLTEEALLVLSQRGTVGQSHPLSAKQG
ncbi:uncharacterized protein LOC143030301 [Oratosquilla oratoria]|uniref:uncharacterized protein LOC143030301 n=1 Tax=Oratosquilla oratoria TaxID=337810 RepID=UPI003F75A383